MRRSTRSLTAGPITTLSACGIDLVIVALSNVHRLGRKRLLGLALQSTQVLAHAVGMGEIHRFLRLGYQAIQPVRDITRFLDTIETREKARLNRIYAALV
jgi:hypothetical protein